MNITPGSLRSAPEDDVAKRLGLAAVAGLVLNLILWAGRGFGDPKSIPHVPRRSRGDYARYASTRRQKGGEGRHKKQIEKRKKRWPERAMKFSAAPA